MLQIPRDRAGEFEPVFISKYSHDHSSIEEKVMYLYGIGMSDRDISRTMEEIYGFSLWHEMIINIPEDILPFIHAWRSRPLQPVYPFVFIDALYANVKDERRSYKKAI